MSAVVPRTADVMAPALPTVPLSAAFDSSAVKARVRTAWEGSESFYATAMEEHAKDHPAREFKSVTALREGIASASDTQTLGIQALAKDMVKPALAILSGATILASAVVTSPVLFGAGVLAGGALVAHSIFDGRQKPAQKPLETGEGPATDTVDETLQEQKGDSGSAVDPEILKALDEFPNGDMKLLALHRYLNKKPALSDTSFLYLLDNLPHTQYTLPKGGLLPMFHWIARNGGPSWETWLNHRDPLDFVILVQALELIRVVHNTQGFLKSYDEVVSFFVARFSQGAEEKAHVSRYFMAKIMELAEKAGQSSSLRDTLAP